MNNQPVSAATRLCMRQCELSDRLARLDLFVSRQDDDAMIRLRAITERELDEIDAALANIAAGTYGVCEGCGEPIGSARIASRPQSAFCESCARMQSDATPGWRARDATARRPIVGRAPFDIIPCNEEQRA